MKLSGWWLIDRLEVMGMVGDVAISLIVYFLVHSSRGKVVMWNHH